MYIMRLLIRLCPWYRHTVRCCGEHESYLGHVNYEVFVLSNSLRIFMQSREDHVSVDILSIPEPCDIT